MPVVRCHKCYSQFSVSYRQVTDWDETGTEYLCEDCQFMEENNLPEDDPDRMDWLSDADPGL